MQADTAARLLEELRREVEAPAAYPVLEVDAARYRDEAVLARERALLARLPRVALPSRSLAAGSCHPIDGSGGSADATLLARDAAGTARAFVNACRHRGTRLVDAPCAAKAFVCPYHNWTYDLDGALRHVPHEWAFAELDLATRGLRELPFEERHGLLWLGGDVAAHLGELDRDFAALALDRHVAWRTARVRRRCNWKLVIEAFLDGYHIRTLHRDSVYRFFLDAASVAERAGDHVRAMTARRTLRDQAAGELRMLATPSYLVFPATIAIVHPDFVSIVNVRPLAVNECEYEHVMLIPDDRTGDAAHWDKSWELIEGTVFAREDLWVCEQIQRSIDAGAVERFTFGALEKAAGWFHESLDRALAR